MKRKFLILQNIQTNSSTESHFHKTIEQICLLGVFNSDILRFVVVNQGHDEGHDRRRN